MGTGWIKLHRDLLDHAVWVKEPFTDGQAWVDLLLLANHKESWCSERGIRLIVPRGCVCRSERALEARWRWSRGKVRRFIQFLVQQNMVTIVQQKLNVTHYIHIVNYEKHQGDDTTDDTTSGTTDSTTDGPQTDQYKNDKNDKNKNIHIPRKKNEVVYSDPDFDIFWAAYEKKGNKALSYGEWKKMNGTRPDINFLLAAIEKYKIYRPDKQYRKDAERWLREKRWDDEIDIDERKSQWEK